MTDNYPEAACKHATDCRILLTSGRFDGAGYLAGYAVECVLKTLIKVGGGPKISEHDLQLLKSEAMKLASLPLQKTAKYVTQSGVTTLAYRGRDGWRETLRYEAAGAVSENSTKVWVDEAQRLHKEIIVAMKLDGLIS
jgi:HEPN domain-containing protein